MNQWMFLFDGYGLNINVNYERQIKSSKTHDDFVFVNNKKEVFQPYLIKFICNKTAFSNNDIDKRREDQLLATYVVDKTQMPDIKPLEGPNPARFRSSAFETPKKDPDIKDEILLEDCAFGYAYKL